MSASKTGAATGRGDIIYSTLAACWPNLGGAVAVIVVIALGGLRPGSRVSFAASLRINWRASFWAWRSTIPAPGMRKPSAQDAKMAAVARKPGEMGSAD